MKKILVTPRSLTMGGDPALDLLTGEGFEIIFSTPGSMPQEDELIRLLPGCVGYLAGVEPISAAVLETAADLKVISRNGTGINTIDLQAAQRLDMNLFQARIRDENIKQDERMSHMSGEHEKQIYEIKNQVEAARSDILKYTVGTIMSVTAAGLALARLII